MLAKLFILVPFELTLPDGAEYRIYGIEKDGYHIHFDVPCRSDKVVSPTAPQAVKINGTQAFQADVIAITFQRDSFERTTESSIDPPEPIIQYALDYFLGRLKYVVKGHQIRLIDFPQCQWTLKYLNDDGSELEETTGHVRGRGARSFSFSFIGCDPSIWDSIFTLSDDFEAPAWHTLMIDSRGALPHIGSVLVLAATALEIFIADLLDKLVKETPIPPSLWGWINDRGHWQKEPSVEEQYDSLLNIMTGHSLKDDNELWEVLKNLKRARNSFVHEGVAKLGRNALTAEDTAALIGKADLIISKIREWVPAHCQWPVFEHQFQIEVTQHLFGPTDSASPALDS